MTERFWIAPLEPHTDAARCELCGQMRADMYIKDLSAPAVAGTEFIKFVHATCLALYCEHHGVKPPLSFVQYCIAKLGLQGTARRMGESFQRHLEHEIIYGKDEDE